MFSAHTKKKFSPCNMAVFFDFDEVLHTSDELEEKESSSPKPVDITLLKQITQLAIKHNYPLIIVTARADNKKNRDFIEQFITLINGFHTDAGGFHLNDIYCLGVESYQRKSHKKSLISIRQPKLNRCLKLR